MNGEHHRRARRAVEADLENGAIPHAGGNTQRHRHAAAAYAETVAGRAGPERAAVAAALAAGGLDGDLDGEHASGGRLGRRKQDLAAGRLRPWIPRRLVIRAGVRDRAGGGTVILLEGTIVAGARLRIGE